MRKQPEGTAAEGTRPEPPRYYIPPEPEPGSLAAVELRLARIERAIVELRGLIVRLRA